MPAVQVLKHSHPGVNTQPSEKSRLQALVLTMPSAQLPQEIKPRIVRL